MSQVTNRTEIYMSEPPPTSLLEEVDERGNNSCPPTVNFVYGYLILFNWNEGVKKPFKLFPRKAFQGEIGDNCVTQKVSDPYRIKKLKALKSLPGQKMSMFAKVESCEYFIKYCVKHRFQFSIFQLFILHREKIEYSTYFKKKKNI